jgi:hypothetical protein
MKNQNELLISFPDQSKSFTYGVEFGRLLERIERGDNVIQNNGFPIRIENKELMESTCKAYGYIPSFGKIHFDEWIEFLGIKKSSTDS